MREYLVKKDFDFRGRTNGRDYQYSVELQNVARDRKRESGYNKNIR